MFACHARSSRLIRAAYWPPTTPKCATRASTPLPIPWHVPAWKRVGVTRYARASSHPAAVGDSVGRYLPIYGCIPTVGPALFPNTVKCRRVAPPHVVDVFCRPLYITRAANALSQPARTSQPTVPSPAHATPAMPPRKRAASKAAAADVVATDSSVDATQVASTTTRATRSSARIRATVASQASSVDITAATAAPSATVPPAKTKAKPASKAKAPASKAKSKATTTKAAGKGKKRAHDEDDEEEGEEKNDEEPPAKKAKPDALATVKEDKEEEEEPPKKMVRFHIDGRHILY